MKKLLTALILFTGLAGRAQTYNETIIKHRQQYKQDFLTDSHSPLKSEDTSYLRFYAPDASYKVVAKFVATPDAKPFEIETHSGKTKTYRKYGVLSFSVHDTDVKLAVYQSITLMKDPKLKSYLFIPFNDMSNYATTYGGGRYIDLVTEDIKDGKVVLDFNKCYNPYCAFAGGYSCPIPPDENKLKIFIAAGEMMFGKEVKE